MRRMTLCCLALYIGAGLLATMLLPPSFQLFLLAIFLVAIGVCGCKR